MSRVTRGGQRATQPPAGWAPLPRLGPGRQSVLFIEETGGRRTIFDLAGLPVSEPIRRWLAECLARQATTRSTVKRLATARSLAYAARQFAGTLAEHPVDVEHPADIVAEHFVAFRRRYEHLRVRTTATYIESLQWLLREEDQLTPQARAGLSAIRIRGAHRRDHDDSIGRVYTDTEWQTILTAARHDVRVARDRIHDGRRLLARYRAGDLEAGTDRARLARLLDGFERTGELPRKPSGGASSEVLRCGGLVKVAGGLCLSPDELAAFAVLLVTLTGQNFGTLAAWPAAHFRPDGGLTDQGLALVESCKPRRGPNRQHMVIALEDILDDTDREHRLFRSPLRVYQLLLDLGGTARRLSNSQGLFAGRIAKTTGTATSPWITTLAGQHGPSLLPGREHPTGHERLVLAYVGLLARGERVAGDGRSAPGRGRARREPRVSGLVGAPPRTELDELVAYLVGHRPGDRLDLRPRDDLGSVVPGLVDTEPQAIRRADDPLPRVRVAVVRARPSPLTDLGDLRRVEQDRSQRPARPRPQQLALTPPARDYRRLPVQNGIPGPGAERSEDGVARSSGRPGRTSGALRAGRAATTRRISS